MALVTCSDCGNQVSDAAAACPKCGAPVPKVVIPISEPQCPFCRTPILHGATVCRGCGAESGYQIMGVITSEGGLTMTGVVLPFLMILVSGSMRGAGAGLLAGAGGIMGVILAPLVLIRLLAGRKWFRTSRP